MLADIDGARNLVELFLKRADARGAQPFLGAKRGGAWQTISWREAADQVCILAQNLRALGLADGDRVVLVSENRPEWCIADLAIMAAGCITVPAYTTNTERDHQHILDNSGARAAIVSSDRLAQPLIPAIMRTGLVEHIIPIDHVRPYQSGNLRCHAWSQMTSGDAAAARRAVDARIAGIARDQTACIIYTSGTGGAPRGVLQHHGMILCNVAGAAEVLIDDFGLDDDDRFLSFLPLSHAYEHTGGQYLPIGVGAQIFYAEGLEKLASNIEETRPTVMVVVPRLFEVLRTRIMKQVEKQGGAAKRLMDEALALGQRRAAGRYRLGDKTLNFILERLLRPKIRARFGGRIKAMVSGGAPLNPEVGVFFEAMGITLLQGYGQTESGPIISCNRPRAGIAMASVGPPLRGVEVRIAEDGEILCRGELVMQGYWQNPAESARALKDGWLHTGDIGHLDEKGRIVITDRKKDMIVNDKGDNVAPQKLEGMLTLQPEIGQALVAGDRRPYVVGLLVPDAEWMAEWAGARGKAADLAALKEDPAFRSALRAAVDRVNAEVSVIEKVRSFAIADEPFSIENEEMTPSMKIRRHKIRERYGDRLDALYRS
ncbi:long-chain fatty acid--CoA ligase [Erythrobacteraceae bacterium CFH 75059]|uniref:AMP-dependent synthetase/ligase n=1 Tax=Qipengyuania thermophila TaxID=2509361 RepID=UPI00101FFF78|nr:long-chain fatty acid--CoA ligase [Qipengyuania thermophila]TCD06619.1 long-chain fatty acid--CoA ligase [Erythrobacteraceae bacterium CFH 75059]